MNKKRIITKSRKKANPNKLITIDVIEAATQGDVEAVKKILKHFEGLIAFLASKTLYDEFGRSYSYVDEDKRLHLEIKLITAISKFNFAV